MLLKLNDIRPSRCLKYFYTEDEAYDWANFAVEKVKNEGFVSLFDLYGGRVPFTRLGKERKRKEKAWKEWGITHEDDICVWKREGARIKKPYAVSVDNIINIKDVEVNL